MNAAAYPKIIDLMSIYCGRLFRVQPKDDRAVLDKEMPEVRLVPTLIGVMSVGGVSRSGLR